MWWPLGWTGTAKLLVMGPSVCMTCGAEKKDRFSHILAEWSYLPISGAEADDRSGDLKVVKVKQ